METGALTYKGDKGTGLLSPAHNDDELELHRVDCTSSHGMLDNYEFLKARREKFASEPLIPPPLITCRDLIALGLKPSPHFAEILEAVESRQLEKTLASREDALAFVKVEFLSGAKKPNCHPERS